MKALILKYTVIALLAFMAIPAEAKIVSYEITSDSVYQAVNSERTSQNLKPLVRNTLLDQAAQNKLNDMLARDYFSHSTPDGVEFVTFITDLGYANDREVYVGENLAYKFKTIKGTMRGWMKSPTHRSNILDSNFTETGIATYKDIVVQEFGGLVK